MLEKLYEISIISFWLVFITHVITIAYYAVKLEKIKKVEKWQKAIFAGMIIAVSIILTNYILGLVVQKCEPIDMIYVCLFIAVWILIYINIIKMSKLIIKINQCLER